MSIVASSAADPDHPHQWHRNTRATLSHSSTRRQGWPDLSVAGQNWSGRSVSINRLRRKIRLDFGRDARPVPPDSDELGLQADLFHRDWRGQHDHDHRTVGTDNLVALRAPLYHVILLLSRIERTYSTDVVP